MGHFKTNYVKIYSGGNNIIEVIKDLGIYVIKKVKNFDEALSLKETMFRKSRISA